MPSTDDGSRSSPSETVGPRRCLEWHHAQMTTGAATPALAAVQRAGVEHRVHRYVHDPSRSGYGDEAVDALGVDPARVCKTLIVAADALLAVAVVPVAAQLDLKRFAGCVDAKRAVLAPARGAERATGYVLGAISPIGQKRSLPTVVDHSVAALDSVFVSGGRRGLEIELAMEDLVRLTGARIAPIARGAG